VTSLRLSRRRRQVAEVNAGLRPPPEASQPQHPVFEALPGMSTEAQRFEAELADSFGPDEAKRVLALDELRDDERLTRRRRRLPKIAGETARTARVEVIDLSGGR
jgi:hypothetical protein